MGVGVGAWGCFCAPRPERPGTHVCIPDGTAARRHGGTAGRRMLHGVGVSADGDGCAGGRSATGLAPALGRSATGLRRRGTGSAKESANCLATALVVGARVARDGTVRADVVHGGLGVEKVPGAVCSRHQTSVLAYGLHTSCMRK